MDDISLCNMFISYLGTYPTHGSYAGKLHRIEIFEFEFIIILISDNLCSCITYKDITTLMTRASNVTRAETSRIYHQDDVR